jgi:hypothetical protein
VSLGIKDCLAKASITSSIELPFLVRISGIRVQVALKRLVVYNRVPKTGSQSFCHVFNKLKGCFQIHIPPNRCLSAHQGLIKDFFQEDG